MDTPPILFLIFNRVDKVRLVSEAIRQAKPSKLFIAADGPRKAKPEELEQCEQTRQAALEMIDWPCEVHTLFRNDNLGCKAAVSSAIDWFFEHVEEGIILEDDCLPDTTFFRFCAELLLKYQQEPRVMMISGNNFQPQARGRASYYFSRYVHIWGWATWRRAWQQYDMDMKRWPKFKESGIMYGFLPPKTVRRREKQFEKAFSGRISTWDLQWMFCCWEANGLTIQPNKNLVTNIDSGGTHMKLYDPCIHRPLEHIDFPLIHPSALSIDEEADTYTRRHIVFRNWKSTLALICNHLKTTSRTHPEKLLPDIVVIFRSLAAEAKRRIQ